MASKIVAESTDNGDRHTHRRVLQQPFPPSQFLHPLRAIFCRDENDCGASPLNSKTSLPLLTIPNGLAVRNICVQVNQNSELQLALRKLSTDKRLTRLPRTAHDDLKKIVMAAGSDRSRTPAMVWALIAGGVVQGKDTGMRKWVVDQGHGNEIALALEAIVRGAFHR